LKEFLDAEVTHFAAMKRERLTLEQLLRAADSPQHAFSYIPIYLHYILLEILKNSCKATAIATLKSTSVSDPVGAKPISVVISSDDHRVAIRISDMAGGVPFDVGDRIWDFGFSGTSGADPSTATTLSGYSLGLPLSRLYARYLGGSLSIVAVARTFPKSSQAFIRGGGNTLATWNITDQIIHELSHPPWV